MDIRTLSLQIDEQTYKQIEEKAAAQGTDTEQVIVQMVQQAMGRLILAQEEQHNAKRVAETNPAATIEGSTVPAEPAEADKVLSEVKARNDFLSPESNHVVAQAQAEEQRIVAQAHANE